MSTICCGLNVLNTSLLLKCYQVCDISFYWLLFPKSQYASLNCLWSFIVFHMTSFSEIATGNFTPELPPTTTIPPSTTPGTNMLREIHLISRNNNGSGVLNSSAHGKEMFIFKILWYAWHRYLSRIKLIIDQECESMWVFLLKHV